MFESVFGRSFNSGKCKTLLRLAISRIKLLRNKRDIQLKQMKKELVQLLQTNQEPSARIRVEHIYREQNVMAAYEIIELFCELLVVRLPIIDAQRQCPIDLKEAVASIIFAAPRCSDLPELLQVRNLFGAKYGKEFVAAAAELRPDCGVNRLVIEKLSIRPPSGEVKLKLMKDIAIELNVDWDPAISEIELLKPPEDLLEGPTKFLGATQMPLQSSYEEKQPIIPGNQERAEEPKVPSPMPPKMTSSQSSKVPSNGKKYIPFVLPTDNQPSERFHGAHHGELPPDYSDEDDDGDGGDKSEMMAYTKDSLSDVAAAAQAAAKSAEHAAAAARAAALLASKHFERRSTDMHSDSDEEGNNPVVLPTYKKDATVASSFTEHEKNEGPLFDEPFTEEHDTRSYQRHPNEKKNSFNNYGRQESEDERSAWRRNSYSKKFESGDWNFDDYDDDHTSNVNRPNFNTHESESIGKKAGAEQPVYQRGSSSAAHVHPNLPDYDTLAAAFQNLRSNRGQFHDD